MPCPGLGRRAGSSVGGLLLGEWGSGACDQAAQGVCGSGSGPGPHRTLSPWASVFSSVKRPQGSPCSGLGGMRTGGQFEAGVPEPGWPWHHLPSPHHALHPGSLERRLCLLHVAPRQRPRPRSQHPDRRPPTAARHLPGTSCCSLCPGAGGSLEVRAAWDQGGEGSPRAWESPRLPRVGGCSDLDPLWAPAGR